jgi:hypothetical protein
LKRITLQLHDERFDVNRHKASKGPKFDFWELAALTSVLDAAIDSVAGRDGFPDKKTEAQFNQEVDVLADRIKAIFTSIQDSGASHLKRTEAKEGLQALHYRLIYGVRTKPRPKKAWFEPSAAGDWDGLQRTQAAMDDFLFPNRTKMGERVKGNGDNESHTL